MKQIYRRILPIYSVDLTPTGQHYLYQFEYTGTLQEEITLVDSTVHIVGLDGTVGKDITPPGQGNSLVLHDLMVKSMIFEGMFL